MEHYLGIDGGGTGSRFAVVDPAGALLAAGNGPMLQVARLGITEAMSRLEGLVAQARTALPQLRLRRVVAGIAGAGTPLLRRQLAGHLAALTNAATDVTEDCVIAAAATLWERSGVALWSSTGSFAVARDPEGRLHRCGGHGHLLSDQGSGFALVRAAAAAALAAADGVGPDTRLDEVFCREFDLERVEGLGAVLQVLDTGAIALRAPLVCAAAAAGDRVARDVLASAATLLARLALAVARRASLSLQGMPIWLGGGALMLPEYQAEVLASLRRLGVTGAVLAAPVTPAHAAGRLAAALDHERHPYASWLDHPIADRAGTRSR